jgi:hypothetical protein
MKIRSSPSTGKALSSNEESPPKYPESLAQVWDNFTRLASVNCWRQNDPESIAMWKFYTRGAEGVMTRFLHERIA